MTGTPAITGDVLKVLVLPAREELDSERQRGIACVWCRQPLNAESAVDLGERPPPERWFPRACRPCVGTRAHTGLFEHAGTCRCCANQSALCDRALHRLIRRHWLSCGSCGRRIEPGQPYDTFIPESGTGVAPAVHLHREPCTKGGSLPPR